MRRKIYLFYNSLLLLWICLMYAIGVWLFSNGFLLIRKPIERKSCCDDSDHSLLSATDSVVMSKTPGCGFANQYDRSVVLLIDELLFDFHSVNKTDENNESLYLIHNIFNKFSNQSKVYKLLEMPSLSSSQTLKSILTGGLQTFIELNTNFKPNDIIEDNLINQLNSKSKRVTLITEMSLKSSHIDHLFNERVYFDLEAEMKDLPQIVAKQMHSSKWDLLVIQIPIISHLQQTYGSKNAKIANQLKQMNGLIENIISFVNNDNKTILFVISDSSDRRLDLLPNISPFVLTFSSQILFSFEESFESVHKIDLVPTLSLLLGIPIPFSNMGKVMSALFEFPMDCKKLKPTPEFVCHQDIIEIQSLWTSISAVRINVAQIQRYVTQSSLVLPNVIQRNLEELLERYDRSWVLLNHIPSDDKLRTIASLKELRNNYDNYITQLTNHLNLNFVTFDNRFLCSGLIVLFLSCISNMASIYCLRSQQNLINFCSKALIGGLMGAFTANLIRFINFSFHEQSLNDVLFLSAVTSIVVSVGSILVPKMVSLVGKSRPNLFSKRIYKNFISFETLFIIFFILSSISSSKTLIRKEESVIHFFFQSILSLYLIDISVSKLSAIKSNSMRKLIIVMNLALLVLSRLSKELHRCHEQQIVCSNLLSILPSIPNDFIFSSLLSIVSLLSILYYLKECEPSDQLSLPNIFSKYLIVLSSVSICGHLCLSLANPVIIEKLLSGNELSVAKTVLYSNAILIILLCLFPLQIDCQKFSNCKSNKRLFISILFLFLSLLNSFLLFNDQTSNFGLILFTIFIYIYSHLLSKIDSEESFVPIIVWYLMTFNAFFTTGHYYSLESFTSDILFTSQTISFWSFITPLSMSSLSSVLMKNDLMVWRIFGLRLVYQMMSSLVTLITVCLIYVFSLRIYFYSN